MKRHPLAKDVFRRLPGPGRRGRAVRASACAVGFAIPVAVLAYAVRERVSPVVSMDERAIGQATAVTRRHPGLLSVLKGWAWAFEPWRMYVAALGALGFVWWRTRLRTRVMWAGGTMLVAWGLQALLKLAVRRVRPLIEDPVSHAKGFSFPSGHAANGAVVAATFSLLLSPVVKNRVARVVLPAGGGLWVLLTCLDRVFLGVHFPTDVTAGTILGVGMVLTSYFGFLGRAARPERRDPTRRPGR